MTHLHEHVKKAVKHRRDARGRFTRELASDLAGRSSPSVVAGQSIIALPATPVPLAYEPSYVPHPE